MSEEEKNVKQAAFAPKAKAEGGLNKVALIGICAAIAIVVFVGIAAIINLIGGWKKPIKNYYSVQNKMQTMDQAYRTKDMSTKNAYKYKYKIVDKVNIKEGRLDDIEDAIDDNYDVTYKIKKGLVVEVDYDGKALNKEDDDIDGTRYFVLIKVGSKWYVYSTGTLNKGTSIEDIAKNIGK